MTAIRAGATAPAGTGDHASAVRTPQGADGSSRGPVPWGRARRITAAGTVATAPVVLLAGIGYHPFIADLRDKEAVAAALTADVTRWSIAHLVVAVGAPLVALAFLAVAAALRQRGEWRWSARSVPFVVVGSTLFALLPAMEITVLAATLAGADPVAVLLELDAWFMPLLLSGAGVFAIGVAFVARSVVSAAVLRRGTTVLVGTALLVAAVSRFLPFTAALLVGAGALAVVLWPLVGLVAARPVPRVGTAAR
ncbi:hypothetical protein FHU33_3865 [Blastococcus colisei]|uniref:DUF4386 family protein n=1 Tax=Blastococcus colisei TaxID=1564162 RepID=A0A543PJV4_9ACTN|nr:hypothetical protein [Blastococcus colisei]TQN44364.1 hypothetical protein FHU33_3865 [Blastococcus colisei]